MANGMLKIKPAYLPFKQKNKASTRFVFEREAKLQVFFKTINNCKIVVTNYKNILFNRLNKLVIFAPNSW